MLTGDCVLTHYHVGDSNTARAKIWVQTDARPDEINDGAGIRVYG